MGVERFFMLLVAVGLAYGVLPWRKSRDRRQVAAERELAVNATRESEVRFHTLVENASDIIMALAADGTVRYSSPAVERMLGYRPEELVGTRIFGLVHPDDVERALSRFAEIVARPGVHPPFEFRVLHKDGSWRYLEHVVNNLLDDTALNAVVVNSRDVTERKRGEEEKTRQACEAALRADVGTALAGGGSLQDILKRCTEAIVCHLDAAFARIWTLNEVDSVLELQASAGIYTHTHGAHSRVPLGKLNKIGLIAEERLPHLSNSVSSDERLSEKEWAEREGMVAFAGYPLVVEERLVGVVAMFSREELAEDTLEALGSVADVIAKGIERKQAEKRLRDTEARYRTLVESIPAITYMQEIDDTSHSVYVSPQVEEILGYSPEECTSIPEHWTKILHPADRERVLAEDRRTNETGEPFSMEYRQLAKDGRIVWVRDEATLVKDEEGNPRYWLGVQMDITDQKWAEGALRKSELQLRSVIANVPVVLFAVDLMGTFTLSEGKGLEALGYEPSEIVGRSVSEVLGHRQEILDDIDRALAGEEFSVVREVRSRSFEMWYAPLRARTGEVSGVIGVTTDITEREQAMEMLREAELRYRTLVEQIPAVTYIEATDVAEPEWGTLYVSPQVEALTGYSPEEWTSEPKIWERILHPDDRERVLAEDARTEQTGERFEMEYRMIAKDGRVVWVRDEAVLVGDALGRPLFWQGVMTEFTEHKELEERLAHLAFYDPLTNLPNRALFMERLKQALDRRDDGRDYTAVITLNLDNFRVVNDSLGHEAGDRLLVAVAERLQRSLRPGDTIARLSGDGFVVLLEVIRGTREAIRVVERIEESLRAPVPLCEQEVSITASVGIALAGASEDQPEALLRNADTAMYRAKDRGKAQYEIFDPSMDTRASERLALQRELRLAVEHGELSLRYQPDILLDSGDVVGMNASVYWEHPERGLMRPTESILLAEGTPLILSIGHWALREACRQAAQWQERRKGDLPLMVCVDLFARQLRLKDLAKKVASLLRETGLEPRALNLWISESVAMKDAHYTISTLEELKSLGVQISISSFGTGYSSLRYLNRFPVDFLVIDSSFVGNLWEGSADATVVSGMISLAHALGITAVAEGVETSKQVAQLRRLGCNLAQGDYFSEPLTSEAAAKFLAATYGDQKSD
ncbi:MAG: PAS domain S-box protein [Actinomycetota bacterium]|nr:PAS domain S-box protein [Actinomycetota bacterium]